MKTQLWLVKQEPDSYPWESFAKDKKTSWDGVRNYQARNNLKAMQKGDQVLFYASGDSKAVVGLAEVSKAHYPDPTAEEEGWVSVELKALRPAKTQVTLAAIKADPAFKEMGLIRNSRLSVIGISEAHFGKITALAGL